MQSILLVPYFKNEEVRLTVELQIYLDIQWASIQLKSGRRFAPLVNYPWAHSESVAKVGVKTRLAYQMESDFLSTGSDVLLEAAAMT